MSIKVSKKFREILAKQGRRASDATMDDVRSYRKMAVTSSAEDIAAHNAAIAAKKEQKNAIPRKEH